MPPPGRKPQRLAARRFIPIRTIARGRRGFSRSPQPVTGPASPTFIPSVQVATAVRSSPTPAILSLPP
jgi:hypothetical protein